METLKKCPVCGALHDFTNEEANQNDLTVCGFCATMLTFDGKKDLQKLTILAFQELPPDDQIWLNDTVYNIVNKHK
jgi:uncharacterized paraquat-inducible protein A